MRKLVGVLGGLLLAGAPFGAHAAAAQTAEATCVTIPVVGQTVCVPPDGVPGMPQLPPTVPLPVPTLPVPTLPDAPVPTLPQLPTPPPLPVPDLSGVPLPTVPPVPQLPGTGTTSTAATAPGAVCSLPSVAGQLAGHDVGTAVNGLLGTAGACQGQ